MNFLRPSIINTAVIALVLAILRVVMRKAPVIAAGVYETGVETQPSDRLGIL